MSESVTDLRAELAEAFKRTATAYGRRLGPFRFELADAALEVFDEDARQKVADELMEATRLRSMEIRNGGFSMDVEPAREIATEYVAAARAMLGGAENYSETPVEFTVGLAGQERYVLVVQRAEKPTPHQMRKKAEAERDEALAEIAAMRDPAEPQGVEWGNRMRIDGRVSNVKRGHKHVAVEAVELADLGVQALLKRSVTYGPWVEVQADDA